MRRRHALMLPCCLATPAVAQQPAFPLADPPALLAALRRRFDEDVVIEAVRRFGAVATVRASFPRRANSNEQWLVIARQDSAVMVMDEANGLAPAIQAGLRANHPDAMLEVGTQAFIRHTAMPHGGMRLVFALPVVAGCRACAVIAIARIGIDADASGELRGAVALGTVPARTGEGWATDPRL